MTSRPYIRCSAALVSILFVNATVIVPGADAAGLLAGGQQRYGLDQDGNPVILTPPAVAGESISPPSAEQTAARKAPRYGFNQNGELQPLPDAAAEPVVSRLAAVSPDSAGQPVQRSTVSLAVRIKNFVLAMSRMGAVLVARLSPSPATATGYRSAPKTSSAGTQYSLLIDSLKASCAVRQVEELLARNGITIRDSKKDLAPQTVHRLVVGTFETLEEAQECLRQVQPIAKQAYLMSHNGVHGVYCGSLYDLQKARERVAELNRAGIEVTVVRDTVEVNRTTILAGTYLSRDAAQDVSHRLRQMGIPAAIVADSESLAALRSGSRRDTSA